VLSFELTLTEALDCQFNWLRPLKRDKETKRHSFSCFSPTYCSRDTICKTSGSGFDPRNNLLEFYIFSALRSTHPPIQWVPGALSLGVKRPEREASH